MLVFKYLFSSSQVACEQAVLSTLAAGKEKEGELATRSQEFEYLHQKSRCEMLIGGDDISNDVITLGTCFSMFVYIHVRFHFVLIGGNLTAQLMGSHREFEEEFKFQRRSFKLSFIFLPCHKSVEESLLTAYFTGLEFQLVLKTSCLHILLAVEGHFFLVLMSDLVQ